VFRYDLKGEFKLKKLLHQVLILTLCAAFMLAGCSSDRVALNEKLSPTTTIIPHGSVENFKQDSQALVPVMMRIRDSDDPANKEDEQMIKDYLNKYEGNPRLSREQKDVVTDVSTTFMSHKIFVMFKDSKDSTNIETANRSLKNVHTGIELLVYHIEKLK